MVSEEYNSSTDIQPETIPGPSSHSSVIPPLCNIEQDERAKESPQLEAANWKRRQRSLAYNASNQALPSVSSTERVDSVAVDAVIMGGLFVDFDSLKVDSSQNTLQKSGDDACDKQAPSVPLIQERKRLSEQQWDTKGLKSLNKPHVLIGKNVKQKAQVEPTSIGLQRGGWGEEAYAEKQRPQPVDMDMSDILEWEANAQEGAFITQRFAHLKAGSEALSDASSVTSSLLSSSYDEPLTMRKRKNSKLCSGFVAKNIATAGTGRKGCSLTEEEDERANQIVSEDLMMVDGIWSKIERQNYLASIEEKHFAEIESRLQAMKATHLKCRKSWFTRTKEEINPAVDLSESILPRDTILQKERSSLILKRRLSQLDKALQALKVQQCEFPLKDNEKRQQGRHHSNVAYSTSQTFAKQNNLMAIVTRPIYASEITEALKQAKQEGLVLASGDELDALMSFIRQDLRILMKRNTAITSSKTTLEVVPPPLPPLCH